MILIMKFIILNPEWIEFYLYNNLFLHNPFLRSPQLIPEGVFFTQSIKDPGYCESKQYAKNFGIDDSIIIISKENEILKSYEIKSTEIKNFYETLKDKKLLDLLEFKNPQ